MKLTNDDLRELYLKDLQLPDVFHGRSTPKVKYLSQWVAIPRDPDDHILIEINMDEIAHDIWCWSDQHFGHKKIIEYTQRPFSNPDHMDGAFINNYCSVVKPNDVVIWGGDVAFMQDPEINNILNQLPGYKVHIIGNHDFDRSNKLKKLAMDETHLCYALNVIEQGREFQFLITHYPLTKIPEGYMNIHGHIHQNIADPWNINICVEHTNYTPMNLRDITQKARSYLDK